MVEQLAPGEDLRPGLNPGCESSGACTAQRNDGCNGHGRHVQRHAILKEATLPRVMLFRCGHPPRVAARFPDYAAWRRAFRSFGAKPSRYPSSVEALLKRIAKGVPPPRINRLVDAYNAVSLRHVVPAGGEDLDRLLGDGRLRIADGSERFIILGEGEERVEHPQPREVVRIDEQDVTCRRWCWRQCRRT
jgi:B3/4 domain